MHTMNDGLTTTALYVASRLCVCVCQVADPGACVRTPLPWPFQHFVQGSFRAYECILKWPSHCSSPTLPV